MKRQPKSGYNDSMPTPTSMQYEIEGMEDALIPYGSDEPEENNAPVEEDEGDPRDN